MKFIGLTKDQLFEIYIKDAEHTFCGWDFSHIKTRIVTEPLLWSYHSIILPFIRSANSLLDMGTGGGEFLASLAPLPKITHATEAYEPNVPIACKRLKPLGVQVDQIEEDKKLPYENDYFDLIINRHESYSASEVRRILKHRGFFITQQVGASNDLELNKSIGAPVDASVIDYLHWDMNYAAKELEKEGFKILNKIETFPKSRCFDVGAIVYYLKIIPWQVPDFSLRKYRPALEKLHEKILKNDFIDITSHYFLIISQKNEF